MTEEQWKGKLTLLIAGISFLLVSGMLWDKSEFYITSVIMGLLGILGIFFGRKAITHER